MRWLYVYSAFWNSERCSGKVQDVGRRKRDCHNSRRCNKYQKRCFFDYGLLQSINVSEGNSHHLSCVGVLFDKSKSVAVKFIAKRYIVTDVIDWFGKDIKFSDTTEDEVTVTVKVNPIAMKMWALKYSKHIKVIFHKALLTKLKRILILQRKIMNKKE